MANLQIDAKAAAKFISILALRRPEVFDALDPHGLFLKLVPATVAAPHPEPWTEAREIADAYIQDILVSERLSAGGTALERSREISIRLLAEVEELCPRWPRGPRRWPPVAGPGPLPWRDELMTPLQLAVFGAALLEASELVDASKLRDAFVSAGEKAIQLSTRSTY